MGCYTVAAGGRLASWLASPYGPLISHEGEVTDNGDGTVTISSRGVALLRALDAGTDGVVTGTDGGGLQLWAGGVPYPLTPRLRP